MVGMWGTMIVTKEAPKSPRSPQSFPPKPKPRRAIGGEGALRGFPALNLSLQPDAKVKFQPTRSVSGPWGSSQPKSQRTVVSAANIDSINLGSHFSFAMAYQYHDVVFNNSSPRQSAQVTVESHIDREPAKKRKLSSFRKSSNL